MMSSLILATPRLTKVKSQNAFFILLSQNHATRLKSGDAFDASFEIYSDDFKLAATSA